MTHGNFVRGALLFLTALGMILMVLAMKPALAAEKDMTVEKALVKRTEGFCKAVLPVWFASRDGMADPDLRTSIVDCYTGQARLSLLGIDGELSLENVDLSELPAVLLSRETGMNLDIYRPLAGRTIRVRPARK